MKLEPDFIPDDINTIRAYTNNSIVVSNTTYESSLILTSDTIIDDWSPENISQLEVDDLDQIINMEPELVLLGTGADLQFPPEEILRFLHSRNIGLEIMDTGAACRAFNFMIADGRDVAAALFMIEG